MDESLDASQFGVCRLSLCLRFGLKDRVELRAARSLVPRLSGGDLIIMRGC